MAIPTNAQCDCGHWESSHLTDGGCVAAVYECRTDDRGEAWTSSMTTDTPRGAHTPGPWKVALALVTHCHSVHQQGGQTVASVTTNGGGVSLDECDANARLIAAAPDLLAAAIDAVAWLDNIAAKMGEGRMLDLLPNNTSGRVGLREAIASTESSR